MDIDNQIIVSININKKWHLSQKFYYQLLLELVCTL
jgi:hypothetical protein